MSPSKRDYLRGAPGVLSRGLFECRVWALSGRLIDGQSGTLAKSVLDCLHRLGDRPFYLFCRRASRLRGLGCLVHRGDQNFVRCTRNRLRCNAGLSCSRSSDVAHRFARCSRRRHRLSPTGAGASFTALQASCAATDASFALVPFTPARGTCKCCAVRLVPDLRWVVLLAFFCNMFASCSAICIRAMPLMPLAFWRTRIGLH